MGQTFKSDECMVITIPLGRLGNAQEGKLMPENFDCVFKDVYKVFLTGQPKALGAAQIITGVFIISLGLLFDEDALIYTVPSLPVFAITGMLTYAAGYSPNMCVTKLSFSLNIISFFWSIASVALCTFQLYVNFPNSKVLIGIKCLTATLLTIEMVIAVVLIYWESKAVCRQHFNILPTITLKQEVGN